jgi:hypothetical protein
LSREAADTIPVERTSAVAAPNISRLIAFSFWAPRNARGYVPYRNRCATKESAKNVQDFLSIALRTPIIKIRASPRIVYDIATL